ncbi:AMIN domain-containing protein [Candidatus Gracilibacteria bacterium]|nr:AMIN domain-containing protein [Candidatus Gracilibacteria bacterium]
MVNKLRSLAMATIALCLLSQSAWAEERIFVRQTQPQNQQQRTSDRVISITGVQLNPTETGLEIALQTAIGEAEQLQISNRTQENTYIAEIPNAQLQLPSGKPFRQENPIKGIREILIANSDRNTIRVSVLGETTAPQVELFDSDEGLIFALTPPLQREAQRSQIISVTGVQLNPTETGIELILQTPSGVAEQLQPNNLSSGNNFIVNIPNAQLQLPSRKPFRQENPTRGISEISATNFDANTIRVMAIGETALPQVELFDSNEGLIFGFTPPPPSLSPLQRGTQRSQEGQIVTIDRVQLNPTETGFEIVLLTPTGDAQNLRVVNISEGNNFIAEIPNAQINLPNTQPFRRENPIEGVSEVTVINQNENTVRVLVIGEDKQPTVELFDSEEGLIFSAQSEASESAQGEEDIELVVTGEQDGYRVPDTSTATRTDTPIRDIPQSIQVIPRQVLEDQKTTRLREALRNVSGVSEAFNFGGTTDSFIIRGFAQFNTLRDGFRIGQGGRETANLERIEVLKGPASVLYGNLEPGGVVNLVTKKPLSEPYYFAEFQAGNYDSYRGSLDFQGRSIQKKMHSID